MIKDFKDLTLDEKIGQLFVVGFNEDYYSEKLDTLIKKYKFGNIIHFTRNIKDMESLFNLNKKIQEVMLETLQIPAFIAIDQEGGMVTRLFNGATVFPGAMSLSATNNVINAYQAGIYMAEEMSSLGVNVNFAPVLDVNTNPLNPGIGIRSYSDDPVVAGEFGSAYIKGLQTKVFATAKHFPGKGDAAVDAHLGLPQVNHDLKRLEEVEIYPFKKAIEAGVKGVMTSHAVYEYLNKDCPATLAKEALIHLLRDKLNFKGLVFTDGMEMQAIDDTYGAAKSAVTAILAGVDLVLYCHYENQQIEAFNYVKEAVLDGTIPLEVLDDRVKRVLKHKESLNLDFVNKDFSFYQKNLKKTEHLEFSKRVLDEAITLVKGSLFKQSGKTLMIYQKLQAITLVEDDNKTNTLEDELKSASLNFTYKISSLNPNEEEINELKVLSESYDQIILTTYNSNMYKAQVELIKTLISLNKDLHVISLRNPYDIYLVPEIENYVCLYEYTNNSLKTLKRYLTEKLKPTGKYPVKL